MILTSNWPQASVHWETGGRYTFTATASSWRRKFTLRASSTIIAYCSGRYCATSQFWVVKKTGVHERVIVSNQGWFNHLGELGGRLERPNLGRKSEESGWNYVLRKRVVFKWSGRGEPANLSFFFRVTKTDPVLILIRWNEWAPPALFHTNRCRATALCVAARVGTVRGGGRRARKTSCTSYF
jgi:hypothetical protein